MKYLSLFSGIEAASQAWKPLGWDPVGFAEIDPFPCAVLKHYYPDVPNLGSVTDITEDQIKRLGHIDVVVGGFPCQDLSVAGKRLGLRTDDGCVTRSGLFFHAIQICLWAVPRFIVMENVPGMLSSNDGKDFMTVLDEIAAIGYIPDCDICDAQYFGLAQRRKRVFLVCESRDVGLKTKSDSFKRAVCITLMRTSLDALNALKGQSAQWPSAWDAFAASDSLKKKKSFFDASVEKCLWQNLPSMLEEVGQMCPIDSKSLERRTDSEQARSGKTERGEGLKTGTGCGESRAMITSGERFMSMCSSWSCLWEDGCTNRKGSTTSTESSTTIESTIYTFAETVLLICERIAAWKNFSQFWSEAAWWSLIALKEFTEHARQTSSGLFTEMEWRIRWGNYVRQAVPVQIALGNIAIESFATVLPLSESLRRNSPPSREARKGTAAGVEDGAGVGGASVQISDSQGRIDQVAAPLTSGQGSDIRCQMQGVLEIINCAEVATVDARNKVDRGDSQHADRLIAQRIQEVTGPLVKSGGHSATNATGQDAASGMLIPEVAPTMRVGGNATGGDRPPGAGVDTCESLIPVVSGCVGANHGNIKAEQAWGGSLLPEIADCLQERDSKGSDSSTKNGHLIPVENAIPFDTTQVTSKSNYSNPHAGDPCHPLARTAHPPAVAFTQNTRDEVREMDIAGALPAQPGMKQQTFVRVSDNTSEPQAFSMMPMNSGKDFKARETDVAQPVMGAGPSIGDQGGDVIVTGEAEPQAFYSNESRCDNIPPPGISPPMKIGSGTGGNPPAIAFKPSWATRGKDGAPSNVTPPLSADADKGDQDTVGAGYFSPRVCRDSNSAHEVGIKDGELHDTLQSDGPGAVAFSVDGMNQSAAKDIHHSLRIGKDSGDCVAFEPGSIARRAGPAGESETVSTLRSEMGDNQPAVRSGMMVRRLTPVECARLQGFPDHFLDIQFRGKPACDGNKYRALGNSMAVPVMAWIGLQIQKAAKSECRNNKE